MTLTEYFEFKEYVSDGFLDEGQIHRFHNQQLEQKFKAFKKLNINESSSILDISTGAGFWPFFLYKSGIKNVSFTERPKVAHSMERRDRFYRRGFEYLYRVTNLKPFFLEIKRNERLVLPKRYDFITMFGMGFLVKYTFEEKKFLIDNLHEYTDNVYIRVNDYSEDLIDYPEGFYYDKAQGCICFRS
tara:strand:- start:6774 stop:7334 length:561 start_codon:yes stop_codon:yes gene_type:complete